MSTLSDVVPPRDLRPRASRVRPALLAGIVSTVLLLAGCTAEPSPSSDAPGMHDCGSQIPFDASNFVDPTLSTNPYHPLKPGLQWVRTGSNEVGVREVPYESISTMTDVIRVIEGVPTIAMMDEQTDSGEVSQVGMDYFGLDRDGNVWLLGGYTEDYQGGEFIHAADAWLGNTEEKKVGILAPAEVTLNDPWCIGDVMNVAPAVGVAVEVGAQLCVAFGCYEDVRRRSGRRGRRARQREQVLRPRSRA